MARRALATIRTTNTRKLDLKRTPQRTRFKIKLLRHVILCAIFRHSESTRFWRVSNTGRPSRSETKHDFPSSIFVRVGNVHRENTAIDFPFVVPGVARDIRRTIIVGQEAGKTRKYQRQRLARPLSRVWPRVHPPRDQPPLHRKPRATPFIPCRLLQPSRFFCSLSLPHPPSIGH